MAGCRRRTIWVRPGEVILAERQRYLHREPHAPHLLPVLKWPGGKQWLARIGKALLPTGWAGTYYEPFLGSASLFLSLVPKSANLSDNNRELVKTYLAIRDDPDAVIKLLSSYPYRKAFYYEMRDRQPRSSFAQAARFIYLNRTCWNGLYRVNKQGKFNTPFGDYSDPIICDEARVTALSEALHGRTVKTSDFESQIAKAGTGDFLYVDPPYITGHQNNGFAKYNRRLFTWKDQERLARAAVRASERGAYVIASNADHDSLVALYEGFYHYRVMRQSLISGDSNYRGYVPEALLSNYPMFGYASEVIR